MENNFRLERLKAEGKPQESAIASAIGSDEWVYGFQDSISGLTRQNTDHFADRPGKMVKRLRALRDGRYSFGRWQDLSPSEAPPTKETMERHGEEELNPTGGNRFKVFERSLLEVTDKGYGNPKVALHMIRAHAAAGNDAALQVLPAAEAAFKENYGRLPEHDEARERQILEQFYPERIADGTSTTRPTQ